MPGQCRANNGESVENPGEKISEVRAINLLFFTRRYFDYLFLLNLPIFLFSAHISYGKGKYLNQTGFFYKICQEILFT